MELKRTIWGVMIAIAILTVLPLVSGAYWYDTAPTNYWALNESSGTAYDDMGDCNLTITGGSYQTGKLGNAYNPTDRDWETVSHIVVCCSTTFV